jgi:hypothetical protein
VGFTPSLLKELVEQDFARMEEKIFDGART